VHNAGQGAYLPNYCPDRSGIRKQPAISTMFGKRAVLFAQRCGVCLKIGSTIAAVHRWVKRDPTGWGCDTIQYAPAIHTGRRSKPFARSWDPSPRSCAGRTHRLGQVASAQRAHQPEVFTKAEVNQIEGLPIAVAAWACRGSQRNHRRHSHCRDDPGRSVVTPFSGIRELGFFDWLFTSAYEDLPNIFDHC